MMALIELTFDEFKEKMKTSNLIKDCIQRTNKASITRIAVIVLADQLNSFEKGILEEHNIVSEFANKSTGAATNAVADMFESTQDTDIDILNNKSTGTKKDNKAFITLEKCKKIRETCKTQTIKELMEVLIETNQGTIGKTFQELKVYFEENKVEGKKVVNKTNETIKGIISDLIDKKDTKQIILTGAPGTGKTYGVKQFLKEKVSSGEGELPYELVQFHSSYDYADFVEGLRPVQLENTENPTFVRLDGNFKAFCRRVINENKPDQKYFFVIDEINRADLSRVFGELMLGLEEGYRGSQNPIKTQYHNLPTYQIEDGIAKKIDSNKDVFKDGFYIPENVYIIGTMNDIDRSVESFDFALRRRFLWVEICANDVMESAFKEMDEAENGPRMRIIKNVKVLNEVISNQSALGLSEAYQIGAAYFKHFDGDNLGDIWSTKVEPLLREYCRGRNKKDVDTFISACLRVLFEDTSENQSPQEQ